MHSESEGRDWLEVVELLGFINACVFDSKVRWAFLPVVTYFDLKEHNQGINIPRSPKDPINSIRVRFNIACINYARQYDTIEPRNGNGFRAWRVGAQFWPEIGKAMDQ